MCENIYMSTDSHVIVQFPHKFRDKTSSLRVINKMVADPATQYFVKCNNLCRDRIARVWWENEEDVDHIDKFCIFYCAYNAIAGVK